MCSASVVVFHGLRWLVPRFDHHPVALPELVLVPVKLDASLSGERLPGLCAVLMEVGVGKAAPGRE